MSVVAEDVMPAMHGNWVAYLQATSEHAAGGASQQFGSIAAISAGRPHVLFNQVFVLEPPSRSDLEAATDWMRERGLPWVVTVPVPEKPGVAAIADGLGLQDGGSFMPGMLLNPIVHLSPPPPDAPEIVPAADADDFEAVAACVSNAFGAPLEMTRALSPPSMLDDDRMSWFLSYVDEEPAACGELVQTGVVAGVYTIAVRDKFRRRGLGEAVTRAVIEAGRARGCQFSVLQSSDLGKPVYERMGFQTVVEYDCFVPAD